MLNVVKKDDDTLTCAKLQIVESETLTLSMLEFGYIDFSILWKESHGLLLLEFDYSSRNALEMDRRD